MCTNFLVMTKDNYAFVGRTLEGGIQMGENLCIVPAGTRFCGALQDGTQDGMNWIAKYGVVGIVWITPCFVDATNEVV